jgi:hypothetical protein
MFVGFEFQMLWHDEDVFKLCVKAWNGSFGGAAEIYEAIGDLHKAAGQLLGFPRSPSDAREVVFGNFDPKFAAGGVRMRFHCVDGAGHAYVEATIDSKYLSGGTVQTVVLSMPVEATAIDTFVLELDRLEKERSGSAYLKAVGIS